MSYYHPEDFIDAVSKTYQHKKLLKVKAILVQILTNSKLCAIEKRPIFQDMEIATVFVKIGMGCFLDIVKVCGRGYNRRS